MLHRKLTNAELNALPEVMNALNAGQVIILDKQVTSNPEYTTLFLAGMVDQPSSSSVSSIQALLLGWNQSQNYIARCTINALTELADGLSVGDAIPGAAIRIIDSLVPAYDEQEPRIDRSGKVYTHKGSPIYRNFVLVSTDELAELGHSVIKRDSVLDTQTLPEQTVASKEKVFEEAAQA